MAEGRSTLSMEEQAGYDRADAEVTKYEKQRQEILSGDAAKLELEQINEEFRRVSSPGAYSAARSNERETLDRFFRGEIHAVNFDLRAASYASQAYRDGARGDDFAQRAGIFGDTDSSGGSLTIPSLVSQTIYQVMNAANIMRRTRATILTTPSGAPIAIPVGTQGAATQIANQDTTIGGNFPTMASKVLHAYDAGELVAISNDMIQDSGVDMLTWVGNNIALSVGTLEETWTTVGTGSGQPTGIMASSATGAPEPSQPAVP
jgi:HK97 family phage major capsid protein